MKNIIVVFGTFVLSLLLPKIFLCIKNSFSSTNKNYSLYEKVNSNSFPYKIRKGNKELLLEKALDIRKFEIDLYWSISKYFWTFIGITFGGYFALKYSEISNNHELSYLVSLIGLVLSIAWYLGNRGSKFWQTNWEKHVDYIENSVYGPLYKTILDRKEFKFWDLTNAYPFSVSRINHTLNIFAIIIWIFLAFQSLSDILGIVELFKNFNILILTLIAGIFIGLLFVFGKSDSTKIKDKFIVRKLKTKKIKILQEVICNYTQLHKLNGNYV